MSRSATLLLLLFIALVITAIGVGGWYYQRQRILAAVSDFESCAAAGFPVMESFPEQCATPDGRSFVRGIDPSPQQPAMNNEPLASPEDGVLLTLTGEVVCLPHRDQTGPQTLECAFGLKMDDGTYYALRDSDPTYAHLTVGSGSRAAVTGVLVLHEDVKYQSSGVLTIHSIDLVQ